MRFIQSIVYGATFGIAAAMVIVVTLSPPTDDVVSVPIDRVALPAVQSEAKPEPQPEPTPKVLSVDPVTGYAATGPAVVMISRSWCGPCQTWKAGPMQGELRAKGWAVEINETAVAVAYPSYRVFDGSRWHTVRGALTGTRLRMLLNPTRYAPAVPQRERVQASGVSWTVAGRPWTRQALIDHLATHPNHGHSRQQLQSMTLSQLDALHTSDHQSTAVRNGVFGRPIVRSVRSCKTCY